MNVMRVKNGFTLVEIIVVVAIIAILLSILVPTLGRVREVARRAQCRSNQHQIILAVNSLASENSGELPRIKRNDGHTMWVNDDTFTKIAGQIKQEEGGGGMGGAVEEIRHEVMFCPNRPDWWKRVVKEGQHKSIRTGYEMLFGRVNGNEQLQEEYSLVNSYDPPALGWRPTYKVTQPQPSTILPGGSGNIIDPKDIGLIIADINEEGVLYPTVTATFHGRSGFIKQRAGAGNTPPEELGSEGGNVGYIDGSVRWRPISEMRRHHVHQNRNNSLGWW